MLAGPLQTWIKRQIAVRQRLERVCTSYLLFLMVVTTKHSLQEAARFSGLHPSLFSKMLQAHSKVAIMTLESLSKTQARQFAKTLKRLNGLPWKIVIIIDSTLQHRASLHPENAKTFNHGKGYVIGHQWTNMVLILGDMLVPLRPIPSLASGLARRMVWPITVNMSASWPLFARSPWRTTLALTIGVRCWCWPIVATTIKRSKRPWPTKAGTSLSP
jgi:hypothetical protein